MNKPSKSTMTFLLEDMEDVAEVLDKLSDKVEWTQEELSDLDGIRRLSIKLQLAVEAIFDDLNETSKT